jgi:hypothetical protein
MNGVHQICCRFSLCPKPSEVEVHKNNTQKFSSCPTEKTLQLLYKYQLIMYREVIAVYCDTHTEHTHTHTLTLSLTHSLWQYTMSKF